MKEVRVCNKEKWQLLHWKTLCASYRRAPYFEYYEEELSSFVEKKYTFLIDVNEDTIALMNKLLKNEKPLLYTTQYEKPGDDVQDLRKYFSPSMDIPDNLPVYMQNFEERHGFLSNLSILDMLFSCGNKATQMLKEA